MQNSKFHQEVLRGLAAEIGKISFIDPFILK